MRMKRYNMEGRRGDPTKQPRVAPSDTLAMNTLSPALQKFAREEADMTAHGGYYDYQVDDDLYDKGNFGRPRYRQPAMPSNTIYSSLGPVENYPGPDPERARNEEYIARMMRRIQDLANAGDPEALEVIRRLEQQNYVSPGGAQR